MAREPWPPSAGPVVQRFLEVCASDERIVAAFLGGSYARGEADAYSDLDLCVVASDEAYEEVLASRADIVGRIGEPVFCEDFGELDVTFFILDDGTEGELNVVARHSLPELEAGPHRPLLDEHHLLPATFRPQSTDPRVLDEALERTLSWFWHELSHFITAVGRDQRWWAMGQLEALRRSCVQLVRIHNGVDSTEEPYEKVDLVAEPGHLAALQSTFVPMDPAAILEAGLQIVSFFRGLAPTVAAERGLAYPTGLDRLMSGRLTALVEQTP